jgi:hypothetical protein
MIEMFSQISWIPNTNKTSSRNLNGGKFLLNRSVTGHRRVLLMFNKNKKKLFQCTKLKNLSRR